MAAFALWAVLVCGTLGTFAEERVARVVGEPGPPVWNTPVTPEVLGPLHWSVRIPGFELHPTEHGTQIVLMYSVLGAPAVGFPDLPAVAAGFKQSLDRRTVVRFLKSEYQDIPDVDLAPVPLLRADEKEGGYSRTYARDTDAYSRDAWWPEELVNVREAMGGTQKVVRVECRPFQYNAARKILRFHREIEFVLEIKSDD